MSTVDFIVDTVGDEELQIKSELLDEDERVFSTDRKLKIETILEICKTKRLELDRLARIRDDVQKKLSTLRIDTQFDDFYAEMGWTRIPGLPVVKTEKKNGKRERRFHFEQLDLDTGKLQTSLGAVDVEKEMESSVLKPGIEKKHSLPQYDKSEKKLRAERKKEREKTKGPEWFDMAAPEITDEVKHDLQLLKMRSALDPKNFKKRNDMEVMPKYFQVGRVLDSAVEHHSERMTNRQRKRTMVDELLDDAQFHKYNKRKYKQIIEEKRKTEYRTHMRDKRQKKKTELKKNKMKKKKEVK